MRIGSYAGPPNDVTVSTMIQRHPVLTLLLAGVLAGFPSVSALATEIHGHRGARGLLPENTLVGFEKAIALGVDVLEMDTGMTADGVVVVLHDRSLPPDLTRRDGDWIEAPVPVRTLTLEQVKGFDVGRIRPGSRTARRFPDQVPVDGTPIPTLAEALALGAAASPTLEFNVETKLSPRAPGETADPETFARALIDVIRSAGLESRTIVQSFDWRTLAVVEREAPEIRTSFLTAQQRWLDNVEQGSDGASPWMAGLDIDDFDGSIPRAVAAAGGEIWSPFHRDLSADELAEARALGIEVHVWTANDPDDIQRLLDMGVDGIITDYPDRAIALNRQ